MKRGTFHEDVLQSCFYALQLLQEVIQKVVTAQKAFLGYSGLGDEALQPLKLGGIEGAETVPAEVQTQTTGENGFQNAWQLSRQENEDAIFRRFLKRLKKGVGSFLVHPVRRHNDADFKLGFAGLEIDFLHQIPQLIDRDHAGFGLRTDPMGHPGDYRG